MFGGLVIIVNGKTCINIGGEFLMRRHDPEAEDEMAGKTGSQSRIIKSKNMKGYRYIRPEVSHQKRISDFI